MRDIKFRGQRIDSDELVYGDLIHGVGHKKGKMYILPLATNLAYLPGCDALDGYEVRPETIGQFTDLKDKNGVEIYEGDILSNPQDKRGSVAFSDGKFILNTDRGNETVWVMPLDSGFCRNKTVIGNIYEHRLLLI